MNEAMNEAGVKNKVDTLQGVRVRWVDKEVVSNYEKRRYGKIKRSLAHYLDCDAIDTFLKGYFDDKEIMLLDLACGTGRLTRTVYRPKRKIISADYSEQMLFQARKNAQDQDIPFSPLRVDGFHLPFQPQTFDAAFTMRFIRHYKEPERIRLYAEIHRILKPQGILIFEVLNSAIDKDAPNRPVHDEVYSPEEISRELEKNGFALQTRLAGNIVKNGLFVILKKWSLIPLGRLYARRLRARKVHLDNAAYWMVYAKKISTQ